MRERKFLETELLEHMRSDFLGEILGATILHGDCGDDCTHGTSLPRYERALRTVEKMLEELEA